MRKKAKRDPNERLVRAFEKTNAFWDEIRAHGFPTNQSYQEASVALLELIAERLGEIKAEARKDAEPTVQVTQERV